MEVLRRHLVAVDDGELALGLVEEDLDGLYVGTLEEAVLGGIGAVASLVGEVEVDLVLVSSKFDCCTRRRCVPMPVAITSARVVDG